MKQTRWIMGMPITISLVDKKSRKQDFDEIFSYFSWVDEVFSTYKSTSEISQINAGNIAMDNCSSQMKDIFLLAEKTKRETRGYFDIYHQSKYDPSGVVKGWAIQNAAAILRKKGYKHFFVDAGGDIQVSGKNEKGESWTVGIRNPFNRVEIVKVLRVDDGAVATSGVYIRGQHIYNPLSGENTIDDIVSLTVVGKDILDADRFATAAFAMGRKGIGFIDSLPGFEGYMIDKGGIATYTRGFQRFVIATSLKAGKQSYINNSL